MRASLALVRTFTGAWIETHACSPNLSSCNVRTFTGAWIETQFRRLLYPLTAFAPSRVRGLKRATEIWIRTYHVRTFTGAWIETVVAQVQRPNHWVRTFTGAWIETCMLLKLGVIVMFAPSRVRGLKQVSTAKYPENFPFAPSRVRGLKLSARSDCLVKHSFAPSRVRGLKLVRHQICLADLGSHLHGCVD